MKRNKRPYIILIPVLTSAVIGAALIICHNSIGLSSLSSVAVSAEKNDMRSEISKLKDEKEKISDEISRYDETINANSTLIDEVNALTDELNSYSADLENAKNTNSSLKSEISEKEAYVSSLAELPERSDGSSTTLEEGEYKCPSDIEAGRYRAEGESLILLYDIANNVTARTDLATVDTHTYEFEILSGEKIKTDGEVTLTKIIETE